MKHEHVNNSISYFFSSTCYNPFGWVEAKNQLARGINLDIHIEPSDHSSATVVYNKAFFFFTYQLICPAEDYTFTIYNPTF